MTEDEADGFQQRAAELAVELEALNAKFEELHDSIPVSPREDVILLGEEDLDVGTNLRSTIECVLADCLRPGLTELRKGAVYRPPGRKT